MASPVTPLSRAEIARIDAGETRLERYAKFVPFFGWIVANSLWTRRAGPIRARLCERLLARPATPPGAWGVDPAFRKLCRDVCEVAQSEMGWPCASFVPDDAFAAVFWSYDDGLDLDHAMTRLEELFGVEISEEDVRRHADSTLREFAAFLFERGAAP